MNKPIWLAAEYHFPSLYSCRMPLSSDFSALSLPAPGPATVRLALIRAGIESFGVEVVREKLFPTIRAMNIVIRPPDKVAITGQKIHGYKSIAGRRNERVRVNESIIYREYCHAEGPLVIYICIPRAEEARFREMLDIVGYWGKSDSLTFYRRITYGQPQIGEGAVSLASIPAQNLTKNCGEYFTAALTEFKVSDVAWMDILPVLRQNQSNFLITEIYVWPLVFIEQRSSGKILHYCSLRDIMKA